MATEHEDTIRTLLVNAGLSNVYIGPPNDRPDPSVFVVPTGGPAPQAFFEGTGGTAFKQARIQIRVRSKPNDYASGSTVARTAYDAIEQQKPTGYVATRAQQSGPIYLETDDEDRHHWSINVLCQIVE